MSAKINPTCPTTCSTVPPAAEFDFCNPDVFFGEIEKIYWTAKDASDLADWTSAAVWAARISNDGVDTDVIRELHVSADLPTPERDKVEISVRRTVSTPATWTINLDIDDLSDENYEMIRTTACNTQVKIWFATRDHIYGGNSGIVVDMSIDPVIERGKKSIQKFTGTITWDATFAEQRTTNIIE